MHELRGALTGTRPTRSGNAGPASDGSLAAAVAADRASAEQVASLSSAGRDTSPGRSDRPVLRLLSGLPIVRWFDSWAEPPGGPAASSSTSESDGVDWLRVVPFLLLHAACLGVLWVGWSPVAVGVAVALYAIRMFAITAFYHRYFSHRAFTLGRGAQLVAAILAGSAAQRGPLWWAAHHRHHHRHADRDEDPHSPGRHGFWWSHVFWITSRENFAVRLERVPDLAVFPELRWLDRFDVAVPAALALALYGAGEALAAWAPHLGTSGPQLVVWGFVVSTVVLLHATFTINSLAHGPGRRRFATGDDSRNSLWLALLTFGEGWHNNHHRFPGAARQGFAWWEVDLTYYVLRLLALLGVVRDLRPVPAAARAAARANPHPHGRTVEVSS